MAKGLIKVGFIDKNTGVYHAQGRTVEFNDVRLKELIALGYVESRVTPEETPRLSPSRSPKKTTKKK